jgi:hypothetical protein
MQMPSLAAIGPISKLESFHNFSARFAPARAAE